MKSLKNKLFYFFSSLLVFKLFALGSALIFFPNYFLEPTSRLPASTENECTEAVTTIISDEPSKKITIDENIVKDATKKFWAKKNGTFIGASYYKAKKDIFKKVKLAFMDINSNFRPIYYIENDEASYAKIFKFIEAKSAGEADGDLSAVEKEITKWITDFKAYGTDMENLVSEYAALGAYVTKIRDLKTDKSINFPFEVEMKLLKNGKEQVLKQYAGNTEDLSNIIFILKGKMKKLKGTSYFRFGAIDTRDFDQALLASRLKSLENEIRDHLANNPNDEEIFKPLLKDLISINRDPQYTPTLKLAAKLEYKEMDAEYKDLFKNTERNYQDVDEAAQAIIKNLSPRYQEKLGLNAVKNWVALMKASRIGIFVGGIGTLGTGFGALALRGWTWLNYDDDSTYDIIHSESDDDFSTKLKKYLKGKYSPDLIRRIEKKNENEMTLKNFNPKNDDDVEILQLVNGIIIERKKFRAEEKLLDDLEKKLSTAINEVSDNANAGIEEKDDRPTRLKPKPKPKPVLKSDSDDKNNWH